MLELTGIKKIDELIIMTNLVECAEKVGTLKIEENDKEIRLKGIFYVKKKEEVNGR